MNQKIPMIALSIVGIFAIIMMFTISLNTHSFTGKGMKILSGPSSAHLTLSSRQM